MPFTLKLVLRCSWLAEGFYMAVMRVESIRDIYVDMLLLT